jgi:hypothetical protein
VAVVLAALLASSGAGSLLSHRFAPLRSPAIPAAIALLIVLYRYGLPAVSAAIAPEPLPVKVAAVFLSIIPSGLLMGIPFPYCIRELGRANPLLIPWGWAINGTLSVLAPLLAVMLAMAYGFGSVLLLGAFAYVLVFINLNAVKREM